MENFILTISFLLIGLLLQRLPQLPQDAAQTLNLFVIYVSLPALVLLKVPQLEFSRELLVPALMPWGMLAVSALAVLLLARALAWSREITGTLLLLVPLGNTSFLGIPMVNAFFGEEGIPYALIYDQFGSFLALATYGSLVVAIYGSQGEKPSWRTVARKIATFPPFLALILALALALGPDPAAIPAPVTALLASLAATLVPVVMIAVGLQLSLRLNREVLAPMGLGLAIKLCLAPLLALLAVQALGLEGLAARVAVFEAGMPPMVSAGALAVVAGLSPKLTAAMVGLGILLSFVTLPLLFQLL
ncbi:AEC family transporter [Desulfurivibrio alkaliphilus]|uniref:Auxin Efflux Carrier n=1 Tax=Desulfurivibrio alkaliphilus (strain DSM 19089 / UNIQEM U267 / AHT2) TaxID=589865 RepID=D6Z058_DESAT|nr:AEC family transporter [Desulfurivibrio alkaliphilus]ADH87091.1 Auxin Efflux Carrier [Desulfurivibrio alkaliphilus AHT 2]